MRIKMKRHPNVKGWYLVRNRDAPESWGKTNFQYGASRFVYDKSSRRVVQMATVLPDGLAWAWSDCGVCGQYFSRCTCRTGLVEPAHVTWGWVRCEQSMEHHNRDFVATLPWRDRLPDILRTTKETLAKANALPGGPPGRPIERAKEPVAVSKRRTPRRVLPGATGITPVPTGSKPDHSYDVSALDMGALAKDAARKAEEDLSKVRTKKIRRKIK